MTNIFQKGWTNWDRPNAVGLDWPEE